MPTAISLGNPPQERNSPAVFRWTGVVGLLTTLFVAVGTILGALTGRLAEEAAYPLVLAAALFYGLFFMRVAAGGLWACVFATVVGWCLVAGASVMVLFPSWSLGDRDWISLYAISSFLFYPPGIAALLALQGIAVGVFGVSLADADLLSGKLPIPYYTCAVLLLLASLGHAVAMTCALRSLRTTETWRG